MCDTACLDLGEYHVPQKIVTNCLQSIGNKSITYKNASPQRKQAFPSQRQVIYVEDIIVTRDTTNFGISNREVIQTTLDIGQACSYVQSENKLYYLIR